MIKIAKNIISAKTLSQERENRHMMCCLVMVIMTFGMKEPQIAPNRGMTLSEVMVGLVLLAVFFASIFELNAVCLRYIDATKESVAALQSVQDRSEMLRNLSFTDLVSTTAVQNLMATAPNAAPFAGKATETVKISAFPTPNGVTQFTRTPSGTVTTNSVATDLGTGLVKVEVKVAWAMTFGGRPRTEESTNILSNGSKK
ncbi:MAG TPA: prepilin-type N-terminal cleavage/methylation domain-containing protein [Chthoniobacterales bacterium]|nr:prepilin-type N-terminal cleavage/methylation domain-containing protein [Chthoniobacterales bacterium]